MHIMLPLRPGAAFAASECCTLLRMRYTALFSCLVGCSLPVSAQVKQPVYFSCSCSDRVGQLYATAFRDLLATTPRYKAIDAAISGTGKDAKYNLALRVVSMDPDGSDSTRTVLAVTITLGPIYLNTLIQRCGKDVIEGCAKDTLASLDEEANK